MSDFAKGLSEFTKKRRRFPFKVVSCPVRSSSRSGAKCPKMKRLPDEIVVGRNPRRVSQEEDGLAFQSRFFKRLGNSRQLLDLLEYLPDVEYFAKDLEGRFVAISRGMLRRIGASAEEEYLGIADSVIHPPSVARSIREDDLHVMRTGKPIVDRVEALFARTRAKDWFLTTKLPVYDAAGEVIGVMGFVRPYRPGSSSGVQDVQVQRVVSHIHEHYRERIPVSEYARIAHLSERQLNRRFQETFRMSLQEFIMRTRIQAASDDLLVTDKAVAEIAHEHGFYDQSSFTKHFRNHTGETPLAFRQYRRLSRELKPGRVVEAVATGGPDT